MLKRPDVSTDEWRSFKAGQLFVYIRCVQKSVEHSVSGETTQLIRGHDAPCSLSMCVLRLSQQRLHTKIIWLSRGFGTTPKYFHHIKSSSQYVSTYLFSFWRFFNLLPDLNREKWKVLPRECFFFQNNSVKVFFFWEIKFLKVQKISDFFCFSFLIDRIACCLPQLYKVLK